LIAHAARAHHYAIGVHGSLNYDLDLIAVPWADEASDPDTLVSAILDDLGFPVESRAREVASEWVDKPHGRRATRILLGTGLYIDLSVTPRLPTSDGGGRG